MDYVITNGKQYLMISASGQPVTCDKLHCKVFDEIKAKNILRHLPRTMKKFHFKLEPVTKEFAKEEKKSKQIIKIAKEKVVIDKVDGKDKISEKLPYEIQYWLDKVDSCNGLSKEAAARKEVLLQKMSAIDKAIAIQTHIIEFDSKPNACVGYKERMRLHDLCVKRRGIKNEFTIVNTILESNLRLLASDCISKTALGITHRKYSYGDEDIEELLAICEEK